jgi:hypothetical protein
VDRSGEAVRWDVLVQKLRRVAFPPECRDALVQARFPDAPRFSHRSAHPLVFARLRPEQRLPDAAPSLPWDARAPCQELWNG